MIEEQLPMVIGIAECQEESELVLQRVPTAVTPSAAADLVRSSFKDRQEYQCMTWRGDEQDSVLIAVREESGSTLELLGWERREENTPDDSYLSEHLF